MKTVFFSTVFAFLSMLLHSQSFFTAGANYTVQSYIHNFPFGKQKLENFKLTPSIGYGYNFQINEKWSYQPGIYLGDLGGINAPDRPRTIYSIYAASLDQFLDYRLLSWMSVSISPSVYFVGYAGITGKSLHVDSHGTVYNEEKLINWKELPGKLNRLVFSIVPRVSFHLKNRWSLNVFYRKDLTSVGYPLPFPPPYDSNKLKGSGVGINLRYLLKSKK